MIPAMDGMVRAFYLPPTVLDAFERDVKRHGHSASRTIRAAILAFLEMSPTEQAACLKRLDERVPPEAFEQPRRGRPPGRGPRPPRAPRQRIVVTNKIMRLQVPPPEQQRTIG